MRSRRLTYLMTFLCFMSILRLQSQVYPIDTIMYNGDKEKIINLVILPDGYTASEMDKFTIDAQKLATDLFNESPFLEYRSYFNTFLIKVPSAESGATHPGTATDVTEPVFPTKMVNNRFGSRFDFAGIHRLLVPTNAFEINNVLANNFPLFDQILVLVNSPFYGGSGGTNATTSLEVSASEIAFHELGHSFAGLSDEYYAGDQYAGESPNMTADTQAESVKWKNWYGDGAIGIYQHCCGGNSENWYRPHNDCKMRFLSRAFCSVCRQQIVETIHFLTNPVYDFEPKDVLLNEYMLPLTFRFDLLRPIPNTLEVKWYLNSEDLEISSDTLLLSEDMIMDGLNEIVTRVEDKSEFLRVDNHEDKHLYFISWEIEKSTTGIELQDFNQFDIKISPNPASDVLYVQLRNNKTNQFLLTIFDLFGRKVLSRNLNNEESIIDLSSLPSNQYILTLNSANKVIYSQRMTKI